MFRSITAFKEKFVRRYAICSFYIYKLYTYHIPYGYHTITYDTIYDTIHKRNIQKTFAWTNDK